MTQEEKYMKQAIRQAKKAAEIGDVPIGCVIVFEDKDKLSPWGNAATRQWGKTSFVSPLSTTLRAVPLPHKCGR